MLRDLLIERGIGEKGGFRWRSHEVSRIEGLSDAVFGFAITLLVVSLDVPRDFTDLANRMRGFIAFAISFAMLVWIWFEQHKYFRRYGLQGRDDGHAQRDFCSSSSCSMWGRGIRVRGIEGGFGYCAPDPPTP